MSTKIKFLSGLILSTLVPMLASAASMDSRIDTLEKTVAMSTTSNPMSGMGAKPATALPLTTNTGWHAQIGFIYEQPNIGASNFAVKQNNPSASTQTTEDVLDQDFKWAWGLTVGAGYKIQRDWDMEVNYMYFDRSQTSKTNVGSGATLVPTRAKFNIVSDASLLSSVEVAKSDYTITLNSFDVTATNIYYLQKYFSTGFKGGLRSQWLKLKQNIEYTGGVVLGNNTAHVNDSSKYWGFGPTGAINNNWTLGKGFSIFSNTGLSLLYSRFKVQSEQKLSGSNGQRFSTSSSMGSVIPELDANLGLMYGSFFMEKKHYIAIRLGWDFHYYWNVNQMLLNNDSYTTVGNTLNMQRRTPNASEDMSMQGLMCDLRWDF
ncbi:MAG: Lpg1974 family pore-forming outer membrane protein [Rhabdochlamydiaceae bacterium]|nr:Lpg1974 family pore-forming outer membrane protein [Candidatus Amphrikana amoebophyrae]